MRRRVPACGANGSMRCRNLPRLPARSAGWPHTARRWTRSPRCTDAFFVSTLSRFPTKRCPMKQTHLSRTLLATALAGAFAFSASAQSTATSAKEQELEAARTQLQQSARRVAELSRELGRPAEGLVVERRLLSKPVLGVLLGSDD